jgi:hypothetical protein
LLSAPATVKFLFPDPPRRVPGGRMLGVAFRTVHLLAVGTLLGGHVFDVEPERLVPALAAAIVSGAGMIALELAATCDWLRRGKGVAALAKVGLLLLVPIFWEQRVALLIAATVLAGIASHMPGRYRHAVVVGTMPRLCDPRHNGPVEWAPRMGSLATVTRGRTHAWTDGDS